MAKTPQRQNRRIVMKAYSDIEQSKVLAKILPIESADMHYVRKTHDFMGNPVDGEWSHPEYGNPDSKYAKYAVQNFTTYEKLPCWSLAALLDAMPDRIDDSHFLTLDKEGKEYCCCYEDINGNSFKHEFADNAIDACVKMILKLKENNLL